MSSLWSGDNAGFLLNVEFKLGRAGWFWISPRYLVMDQTWDADLLNLSQDFYYNNAQKDQVNTNLGRSAIGPEPVLPVTIAKHRHR